MSEGRLPSPRPACPSCSSRLRISGGTPLRTHPEHGKLVRLTCRTSGCERRGRALAFTTNGSPVPLDRRRPRHVLPGRDHVKCRGCGGHPAISMKESRLPWHRYVFRCTAPDCAARGARQWWELREGAMPKPLEKTFIRHEAVAKRPRLDVPLGIRKCPSCTAWRHASHERDSRDQPVYRLTCPSAPCMGRPRSKRFTLGWEAIDPVVGHWRYPAEHRPTCRRCRRPRAMSRPTMSARGKIFRYICSESRRGPRCLEPPEFRLAADGQVLTVSDVARLRTETNFKVKVTVPIPGFDRAERARCPSCERPMAYEGIKRQGTACVFACRRGHPGVRRYFSTTTGDELPERLGSIKAMPWGERPPCPGCGGNLLSKGERRAHDGGQTLYVLFCRRGGCGTNELYFDASGEVVHKPRRVVRIATRLSDPQSTKARWCESCNGRRVNNPGDRRGHFCDTCRVKYTEYQLWRRRRERQHGSIVASLMERLRRPRGVRLLRKERGWTQKELAKRSGLSLPSVKRLEQGTMPLTRESRDKIAAAFAATAEPSKRGARGRATRT